MSTLKKRYESEIIANLKTKFGYKNTHQIPKLTKIIVNCTSKDCVQNAKSLTGMADELAAITGQRPVITKAKKSIANFKIREGMPIGAAVTLRGERMYEFVERLVSFSLPRVRDFRGISPKGFDGRGNYTLGIKEQIVFPEISYDKIEKIRGIGITFVTTAKTNDEGRELLTQMGLPFRQ
jgi:large subunit ribosomal protein L5